MRSETEENNGWYPGKYAGMLRKVARQIAIINAFASIEKPVSDSVHELKKMGLVASPTENRTINSVLDETNRSLNDLDNLADTFVGKQLIGKTKAEPLSELADTFVGKQLIGKTKAEPSEEVILYKTQVGKMLYTGKEIIDKLDKKTAKIISNAEKDGASKMFINQVKEVFNKMILAIKTVFNNFMKLLNTVYAGKVVPTQKAKEVKRELSLEDSILASVKGLFNNANYRHENKDRILEKQKIKQDAVHGHEQGLAGANELFSQGKQQRRQETEQGRERGLKGARDMFTDAQFTLDNKDKGLGRMRDKKVAQQGEKDALPMARKMFHDATNAYDGKAKQIKDALSKQKGTGGDSHDSTPSARK